jgi:hypothetical protein
MKEEFNLNLFERIQLLVAGFTIKETLKGRLYIFNCKIHGVVGTYKLHGYEQKMYCPECLELLNQEKEKVKQNGK